MAVRDDFSAGEVLAAADLNDTFASKLPYAYGTATPSTSVDGFLWYDENDTPPTPKFWDGAAFQALTSGKILQVVRATDSTLRQTTSTDVVDVTGMSVTITPQKSNSAIVVIGSVRVEIRATGVNARGLVVLTDSSDNALSGAEKVFLGQDDSITNYHFVTMLGYSTPATTSATTYKMRFRAVSPGATIEIQNDANTGQLYAIEVSA